MYALKSGARLRGQKFTQEFRFKTHLLISLSTTKLIILVCINIILSTYIKSFVPFLFLTLTTPLCHHSFLYCPRSLHILYLILFSSWRILVNGWVYSLSHFYSTLTVFYSSQLICTTLLKHFLSLKLLA